MAIFEPIYIDDALSRDECEALLATSMNLRWQRPSPVGVLLSSRLGVVSWLELKKVPGLKKKIHALFASANSIYKFALDSNEPQVQLTRYRFRDSLDWHHDCDLHAEHSFRKLTLSILLNDEQSFSGGDLEIYGASAHGMTQRQGTAVMFPTFLQHRVCRVAKGQRVTLVTWALGPAFR